MGRHSDFDAERIVEAGSFVPLDVRLAAADCGASPGLGAMGVRTGALLACDVAGFSDLANRYLSEDGLGADALHKLLDRHFRALLQRIVALGGKPLFYFGDALLSIWDTEDRSPAAAARAAVTAGRILADDRRTGALPLDLNLHVASGQFQLVDVGGNQGQWHLAAIGSAMTVLQRIGAWRAPNKVIVDADCLADLGPSVQAATLAPHVAVIEQLRPCPAHPIDLPTLPPDAMAHFLSRSPKSVRRWLSTLGLQWVAEQRPVTATLTTLRRFDQSAPDAAQRLDLLVRRVQEIVHAHDGAIDNVMIDDKGAAILSVFGVPPDAHSDDPARGLQSALDMRTALLAMGQDCTTAVSSGLAFCALIGDEILRSYMVVGDVVTRASRLSAAMAPKDGVLADEATMRATESLVGYGTAPRLFALKGIAGPTKAWPVPPRKAWTVRDRSVSGRDGEMSRLRESWSVVNAQRESVGVIVVGDSGAGKTTLAMALRDTVVGDGGLFLVTGSVPVDREVPFSGLSRITMEALGLTQVMSLETRRRVIQDRVPAHLQQKAPLLETLFPTGLKESSETARLSGRARAKSLESVVTEIILSAFGDARVCLCFEDAQWLDDPSRRVLGALIDRAPSLMIVVLQQTQIGTPVIATPRNWTQIALGTLDDRGLADLICSHLRCTAASHDLVARVSDISAGHPFFASEVVQSLFDVGEVIVADDQAGLTGLSQNIDFQVPSTVFGTVLQRFDRLEPDVQLSLRAASVVGPQFSLALAMNVHPLDMDLTQAHGHFAEHVRHGFLDTQVVAGENGYRFRHQIVRDVAYSQVPQTMRRELHTKVAHWLESERNQGSVDGSLGELAHHWAEAGETGKAIAYLEQEAARVFAQGFANSALALGERAVRLSGVDMPQGVDALRAARDANMAAIEALAAGRSPIELARDIGPPRAEGALKLQAYRAIAPFAFQSNNFDIFSWAASASVRLALEIKGGTAHELALYSVIVSALTGNRALGAEWSRAALALDGHQGGSALPAVGFLDTWFHAHWRDPMARSAQTNRAAARKALQEDDLQYASYNIAGEVVMTAARGSPLCEVIALGERAFDHNLVRNSETHVHLEVQFARALRGETSDMASLGSDQVDEDDLIAWVLDSEFANQVGYYRTTQLRLCRFAGDLEGAMAAAEAAAQVYPAIAGQTAEIDLVFHGALARLALMLRDRRCMAHHLHPVEDALSALRDWASVQSRNFGPKAAIVATILDGLAGDTEEAAAALSRIGQRLGPDVALQDRAVAFEFAARLDPRSKRQAQAVGAFTDWGAYAVADRLARDIA